MEISMRRKNIRFIIAAAAAAFVITGCGSNEESSTQKSSYEENKKAVAENDNKETDNDDKNKDTSKNKETAETGEKEDKTDSEENTSLVSDAADKKENNNTTNNASESSTNNKETQGNKNNTSTGSSGNGNTSKPNTSGNGNASNSSTSGSSGTSNQSTTGSSSTSNQSTTGSSSTSNQSTTGSSSTSNQSTTGSSSSNAGTTGNSSSSSSGTSTGNTGNTTQSTTKAPVKVETETTATVSVGNANSQISEQNKDIVNDNKTEYTDTSNNSSTKKIYVSPDSANYGYALAYVNGDTSKLDATQKQIFAVVKPLIDDVMKNYSTDPEREKAVHDYIVSNCRYNIEACENLNAMEEYNFHPEGVFLKKKAVCQGYAESFKLCMDLLGIKCDIVTGTGNGQAHAWNAVCLDNEWYQIDCTWDDPLVSVNGQPQDSGSIYYNYFNITDAQMRQDHVYTYGNACNGTKYNYDYFAVKEYGTIYSTVSDYSNYVNSQLAAGNSSITAYVKCEGNVTIDNYLNSSEINYSNYPATGGFRISGEAACISSTIYVITITITE